MSDNDRDEAQADIDFEDAPDPRDRPRGYARGYIHGVTLFYTLLERYGFADYQSIYEYCSKYHELLLQWQCEEGKEGEQGPPAPPSYQ